MMDEEKADMHPTDSGYILGFEDEGYNYGVPDDQSRASESPIPSGFKCSFFAV